MQEKLTLVISLLKEKKYLLAGLLAVALLAFLSVIFTKDSPFPLKPIKTGRSVSVSPAPTRSLSIFPLPLPQVYFDTYENKASLPVVPGNVNTYAFKTNYTLEGTLIFGKKLGLTQHKEEGNFVVLYEMNDMYNRGILTFNKETGAFSFQSWGVHKFESKEQSDLEKECIERVKKEPGLICETGDWVGDAYKAGNYKDRTRLFLANLGIIDPTVSCPITYQKKNMEGITFVECHRDWAKAGLPILNAIGVLNIPENKPLSQISLGGVDESSPVDESIVNVSTGENGKVRPNDFNTITAAIASDGRILSIESNLRQIAQTKAHTKQELLTPDEALTQFMAHKSQFSLTLPAGAGTVDWGKVYPNHKAYAKKAVITDYLLTYLEKPSSASQNNLVPMYEIRGIAELNSGYRVRFAETLPALKSGLSFIQPAQANGSVAGVSTSLAQGNSIHFGSFTPEPTLSDQNEPTPTPTPPLAHQPCQPPENAFDLIFSLPDIDGRIGLIALGLREPGFNQRRGVSGYVYYYLPLRDRPLPALQGVVAAGESIARQRQDEENWQLSSAIYQDWKINNYCPKKLTGESPFLYLYPQIPTQISVKLGSPLTYTDPAVKDNSWEVIASPDGTIILTYNLQPTTYNYHRLYYEYDKSKVKFNEPEEGFVVERSQWEMKVGEIAHKLGLTDKETEDLVVEVRNALFGIKSSPYLKISFVDGEEIGAKLPISINPAPTVFHRVHLLLTLLKDNTAVVKPPRLDRLSRTGFTVIELGAAAL